MLPGFLKKSLFVALFYLCATDLHAQMWTWVSGDSIPDMYGVYGSMDLEFKPGARTAATSWTDKDGNLWLFGGTGYAANGAIGGLNDLWKYNIETNRWYWIKGSSGTDQTGSYGSAGTPSPTSFPGARRNAVSWTDLSGNLWLYGGLGNNGIYTITYSDVWMFSPALGMWTWMRGSNSETAVYGTAGLANSANTPGERSAATTWTDNDGDLWLFGGSTAFNFKSDLWRYHPASNTWTWINGGNSTDEPGIYGQAGTAAPANHPGARSNTFCFKDRDDNFWLFGGYGYASGNNPGGLNDLWKYNMQSGQWTWMHGNNTYNHLGVYGTKGVPDPGNAPGSRLHMSGWTDPSGNLWLFGGKGLAETIINQNLRDLNDLWKYDITLNEWTWISGADTNDERSTYGELLVPAPENTPGARYWFSTWSNQRGLWLFGGAGQPGSDAQAFGYQNDLWRFGGDTLAFSEPVGAVAGAVMPNVFSPNNDGINDLFLPIQTAEAQTYSLVVLNRWGDKVFETSDPAKGWDGAFAGESCTDGVYFWKTVLVTGPNKQVRNSGFVTLVK